MTQLLINIDVDDLERAVDFYTRAFALTPGRRFGDAAVELLGAGAAIYLLHKPAGSLPFADGPPRTYARHWTPVHLDLVCDDVDAALARALAAGAVLEAPLREAAWGRIVMLADPFGHGVCLLEFSERGYDALLEGS